MTTRAVVVGLILSVLACVWTSYSSYISKSSLITIAHFPIAALFPFVFVVLVLNVILKTTGLSRGFRPAELLVIFFMLLTASAVPGWAFTTYWVALVATPYYFATPENQWGTIFFPHLPDWLVASNQGGAMEWFFEGLPAGKTIPWGAWLPPFVWWSTFFFALFVVCACLMVILRKQWVEYEKLTFPLTQVPLLMIREMENGQVVPTFVRNRLFQMGFGLTLFILCWNMLAYFYWVSPIPIGGQFANTITIAKGFPPIIARLHWLVFGFAFFANVDVLFSIWVFRLLAILQEGSMAQFGFNLSNPNAGISSATAAQNIGGYFFFVLWGLWMARRHLRAVFLKAIGRAPEVDDSDELLSYRWALIGIVVGSVYLLCWLNQAGMALWVAALLLGCVLLLYLGITRIVAEAGVVLLDLPLNGHDFTVSIVGTSNLSPSSLTAMGMANAFARNWRTLGMCAMAHVAKAGDEFGSEKRRLFWVIYLTLGVSILTCVGYTIYLAYTTVGAYHFGDWGFAAGNRLFYDNVVKWITTPTALGSKDLGFLGFGAGFTWLLILLRYRFPGWPLHPVGFAIASAYATAQVAFSIFLAWLIKALLLRLGGAPLYKKAQPFFIGLLVALSVGVVLSFLVDLVWFPGQGHEIESW